MPRVVAAALVALIIAVPAVALAADDTEPKKQFNAGDQAKARSIVLKRSDFVAGWKKSPPSPDSDVTCPGYNPDNSDLTLTGESEAEFEYTQGFPVVASYAGVLKTMADASRSWTRNVKPALARCLAHVMRVTIEEDGGKLAILSQGRIAFPKLAPRTAAFRVATRLTVQTPNDGPVTVPVTLHVVALGHGRGEVALLTMGFGPGVPMAELRAFASVLASRLAAAKL
jgi:hypothetical protein